MEAIHWLQLKVSSFSLATLLISGILVYTPQPIDGYFNLRLSYDLFLPLDMLTFALKASLNVSYAAAVRGTDPNSLTNTSLLSSPIEGPFTALHLPRLNSAYISIRRHS